MLGRTEYLAKERASMDELMDEACAAISLLHERRSALISAAVTGKIDVRGWSTGSEEEPGLAMVADQDASYSAHGGTA
jgi:type I restriction enzyme S subunit